MKHLEPAPAEFFEGTWKVTEKFEQTVEPMTEEVFAILTPSSNPSAGIVFHLKLAGENDRSLELAGINYDEVKGKIDGLGHDLKAGSATPVKIHKTGDSKIEMCLECSDPDPRYRLVGTYGAEKAGGT